ncbi:tripartite tricarboxylate transporter substrate-binding protein [Cupriavidus plantarum]|uniref:Tripartite-type tricarboxylate transporter receptor subunit TctC n=1 Tax=Cupriavidus plantarum TaxID=942865 RepID=A0A316ES34_9BURK|nr:tripartite tricarboxylate transporter substrate-binding protein [Cupriavidus plantarum]PWK35264.1 tripartite-type tricarboxylate transporter receptor subunit TctC [Cupriavidus plantarum]
MKGPHAPILAMLCSGLLGMASLAATAQEPALPKTIRIVVPFSPGGSNDLFARALAQGLAGRTGSSVVVENRPGAGGAIGAQAVATGEPDGSTLLLNSLSFSTNAAIQPKLPYDPIKSFEPVALLNRGPMLLVTAANTPYKSVKDVVEAFQGKNKSINFGSAGPGSSGHLGGELLNALGQGRAVHVPYKGVSNAVVDMVGGNVQVMITTAASVAGPLKSGQVRAIAVTSAERSRFAPGLPTVAETLPGFVVEAWWGVFAPAKTPQPVVERLNQEIRAVAETPAMRELFSRESTEPSNMTAAQFASYVQTEVGKWRTLVSTRHVAVAAE